MANYNRQLPRDWGVSGGYKFENVNYSKVNGVFNRFRKDNIHTFSLGVTKTFWSSENKKQSLMGNVDYAYTKTFSNTTLFIYDRHLTTFGLTYKF